MTLDEYFHAYDESRRIFNVLQSMIGSAGPAEMRVTKSQVAFRRKKGFAWAWIPEKSLHRKAAPLVLSLAFRERDPSPRWKEVVEPYPGRFMHHLELYSAADLEVEVQAWLRAAWVQAG